MQNGVFPRNSRVLADWGMGCTYGARVIDTRFDPKTGRLSSVRVKFEADGQIMWCYPDELSALDQGAVVRRPTDDESDGWCAHVYPSSRLVCRRNGL